MRRSFRVVAGVLAGCLAAPLCRAEEPVVVTDADGKEHRLTGVKFTTGTRRLAWLADPNGETPDQRLGPLAVAVREPHSTTYSQGVVTLVPVGRLGSATYDYGTKTATLAVKGMKQPLTGTLEYKGINTLGLTGMEDGKTLSFTGGVAGKAAVKSVAFPNAEAVLNLKPGGAWAVQIVQPGAENPTLIARNLKPLYQYAGGAEQLADGLLVRKGPPLPFDAGLKRFEMLANDTNTHFAAAEVETGAGPERVIAIPLAPEQDKKTGTLVGLVGEVDAGYKLFPLHTIKLIKPHVRKVD